MQQELLALVAVVLEVCQQPAQMQLQTSEAVEVEAPAMEVLVDRAL
jgi:hypothetical protein